MSVSKANSPMTISLIPGAVYVPNGTHPSFRKACRLIFADDRTVKTRSHVDGRDGAHVAKWDISVFLSAYRPEPA